MQGMTPDQWADANAEMFTQEATEAIWPAPNDPDQRAARP
jgi:hypothetical protein